MKTLRIGIAGDDQMKSRTLAIARGDHTPAKGEPKVWFTSIESFAKLLSEHNRHLLQLIAREKPGSLTELAKMAGRSKSNLSRTLKTIVSIRARGIATGRAWEAGPSGALRPREARCLVDFDAVKQNRRKGQSPPLPLMRNDTQVALQPRAGAILAEIRELGSADPTAGGSTATMKRGQECPLSQDVVRSN